MEWKLVKTKQTNKQTHELKNNHKTQTNIKPDPEGWSVVKSKKTGKQRDVTAIQQKIQEEEEEIKRIM